MHFSSRWLKNTHFEGWRGGERNARRAEETLRRIHHPIEREPHNSKNTDIFYDADKTNDEQITETIHKTEYKKRQDRKKMKKTE